MAGLGNAMKDKLNSLQKMASQESSDTTQAHQQLLEENSNMKKQIDKLNSKLQDIKLGG